MPTLKSEVLAELQTQFRQHGTKVKALARQLGMAYGTAYKILNHGRGEDRNIRFLANAIGFQLPAQPYEGKANPELVRAIMALLEDNDLVKHLKPLQKERTLVDTPLRTRDIHSQVRHYIQSRSGEDRFAVQSAVQSAFGIKVSLTQIYRIWKSA